jgi:hypothetical protein
MQIEFEITKNELVFRDAIHLPDDHTLSDTEIDMIKQQRFENWLAATVPELVEE